LSNRHCSRPAFEIVVQGCLVLGTETTRHPCGNGTRQGCPVSSFSIEKLHDNSVVAPESSIPCALASRAGVRSIKSSKTKKPNTMRRIVIIPDGNTILYLAATERAA